MSNGCEMSLLIRLQTRLTTIGGSLCASTGTVNVIVILPAHTDRLSDSFSPLYIDRLLARVAPTIYARIVLPDIVEKGKTFVSSAVPLVSLFDTPIPLFSPLFSIAWNRGYCVDSRTISPFLCSTIYHSFLYEDAQIFGAKRFRQTSSTIASQPRWVPCQRSPTPAPAVNEKSSEEPRFVLTSRRGTRRITSTT